MAKTVQPVVTIHVRLVFSQALAQAELKLSQLVLIFFTFAGKLATKYVLHSSKLVLTKINISGPVRVWKGEFQLQPG